jgi:hypothetical protein
LERINMGIKIMKNLSAVISVCLALVVTPLSAEEIGDYQFYLAQIKYCEYLYLDERIESWVDEDNALDCTSGFNRIKQLALEKYSQNDAFNAVSSSRNSALLAVERFTAEIEQSELVEEVKRCKTFCAVMDTYMGEHNSLPERNK